MVRLLDRDDILVAVHLWAMTMSVCCHCHRCLIKRGGEVNVVIFLQVRQIIIRYQHTYYKKLPSEQTKTDKLTTTC